ncbi:MAG: hypothetical protein R3E31_28120 [Chloroflexota bacterium]
MIARRQDYPGEYCMRCKDGRSLPVEISARMLSNGNFLAVVRDISKRKQRKELKRSNNLLRAIIEAAPAAIVGLDLVGQCANWSGIQPQKKCLVGVRRKVMGLPLPSVPTEAFKRSQEFSWCYAMD